MVTNWLSRLDALPVPRPVRFLLVGLSGGFGGGANPYARATRLMGLGGATGEGFPHTPPQEPATAPRRRHLLRGSAGVCGPRR